MLVVHWSPVNNTKNILKNGITKSQNGVYCFPVDYQIVLTKSIEANRIIRVIPPTEQFGTILYKNKKHKYDKGHLKEAQRFD